uniref:Uncharacterized protein n=1 Tax=Mesocestoides corti TaxID=53468 RepID=A0A5K3F4A2_MESCO
FLDEKVVHYLATLPLASKHPPHTCASHFRIPSAERTVVSLLRPQPTSDGRNGERPSAQVFASVNTGGL